VRIGLDASKIIPPRDGISSYTLGLLRALAEADGHELVLYGSLHPLSEADVATALPGLEHALRLAPGRWPEAGEVDLFHATSWSHPPGFDGPVVMTCYDLTFLSHPSTHTLENKIHCLTGLLEALLDGAVLVAISEATRRELASRLEVPTENVRVIYPAADGRFQPLPDGEARARVRERFGLESAFLLAVGTLEPRKNLSRLLDAHAALDAGERLPLAIVGGDGWGGEDLAARIASDDGLSDVQLLGQVVDDDLPALYRSARALVYPSLAEGFGLPVLEAMSCGTPVLASNAGALPEVVGGGGQLIDPFDTGAWRSALAECAARPEVTPDERRRALDSAGRFSWEKTARETLELYDSLLSRSLVS